MGRWRPARQRGSAYITPAGAQRMQDELKQLWKVERPVVTNTVHEAAKNGDRSENGDYIYGKKRLREIDSRVRFLSKRLEELTVVDRIPDEQDKIFFGAYVTVKDVTVDDEGSDESTYQIVGPDEFDVKNHKLSMDSPLAQRLLGKRLEDEISLQTPEGDREYYISAVEYRAYEQE